MSQLAYESPRIQLELFEGPLDLLLYLIRKNDINIYDIPILTILDQYTSYLEILQELDIDVAGDFVLMASELSFIKSRFLLASDDKNDEEGPDPRADLVAKLLEYQQYKLAGDWLIRQPLLDRDVFARPGLTEIPEGIETDFPLEIEPFKLLQAFHEILKKASKEISHEVEIERLSVTDRIYQILEHLKVVESLDFESLFDGLKTKSQLVITFLALLEMGRLKLINLFQVDPFGNIHVKRMADLSGTVI